MTRAISISVLAAGCYAALPPPTPPHVAGTVTATGGTLGTWQLHPTRVRPVDGALDAIDLVDPAAPGRVVRLTRAQPPPETHGKYVEPVASRDVEIRIASGDAEVVLTRDRCSRLDAIARSAGGVAFASARFDCDLGAAGRVIGDVEAAAGGFGSIARYGGHLEASDGTLAHTRFEPDQGETDPRGVLLWDHRYPRVVFELEEREADTSIHGAASNAILHVRSTAGGVPSFDVAPESCRVLRLDRAQSGYLRVGTKQYTSYSGTVAVDCDAPGGGRLVGELSFGG